MTKEHFEKSSIDPKLDQILIDMGILKYSGLHYSTYMPAVHIESLREAMSRYTAINIKVLIDALQKIEAGVSPSNEREAFSWIDTAKEIASAALTSYAEQAPPVKLQDDIYMKAKKYAFSKYKDKRTIRQMDGEQDFLEGAKAALEGQVTGKSAGVWVKEEERWPKKDGAYVLKFSDGEMRIEKFRGGYWVDPRMLHPQHFCFEWLDESGEAGKLPEQQPADPWIPTTNPPKEGGRYWCLVKEITDLGIGTYQWNCYYDPEMNEWRDNLKVMHVTHWTNLLPLPGSAQSDVSGEQKGGQP